MITYIEPVHQHQCHVVNYINKTSIKTSNLAHWKTHIQGPCLWQLQLASVSNCTYRIGWFANALTYPHNQLLLGHYFKNGWQRDEWRSASVKEMKTFLIPTFQHLCKPQLLMSCQYFMTDAKAQTLRILMLLKLQQYETYANYPRQICQTAAGDNWQMPLSSPLMQQVLHHPHCWDSMAWLGRPNCQGHVFLLASRPTSPASTGNQTVDPHQGHIPVSAGQTLDNCLDKCRHWQSLQDQEMTPAMSHHHQWLWLYCLDKCHHWQYLQETPAMWLLAHLQRGMPFASWTVVEVTLTHAWVFSSIPHGCGQPEQAHAMCMSWSIDLPELSREQQQE